NPEFLAVVRLLAGMLDFQPEFVAVEQHLGVHVFHEQDDLRNLSENCHCLLRFPFYRARRPDYELIANLLPSGSVPSQINPTTFDANRPSGDGRCALKSSSTRSTIHSRKCSRAAWSRSLTVLSGRSRNFAISSCECSPI